MAASGVVDVVMNNLEHAGRTVKRLATFHANALVHIDVMARHDPSGIDSRMAGSKRNNTPRFGRMVYSTGDGLGLL